MSSAGDSLSLLKSIKGIVFNFQEQKYLLHSIHVAKRRLYTMTQGKTMSCQDYLVHFQNCVDVIRHCGGTMGEDEGTILDILTEADLTIASANSDQMTNAKEMSIERYLSYVFICSTDRNRYGELMEDLENSYTQGIDKYPKSLTSSFNLIIYWKFTPTNMSDITPRSGDGLEFATTDGEKKMTPKNKMEPPIDQIQCFKCRGMGHYAGDCTGECKAPEVKGKTLLMEGVEPDGLNTFQFRQHARQQGQTIPADWILLHNQSTVDTFSNPKILINIRQAQGSMNVHCNAGVTRTKMVGDLPGYGTVWYDTRGIANILSFAKVCRKHRVTYDNTKNEFVVHKANVTHHFRPSPDGLYYLDTAEARSKQSALFLTTVEDNKDKYTKRQVRQAEMARKISNITGLTSRATMDRVVSKKILTNLIMWWEDQSRSHMI